MKKNKRLVTILLLALTVLVAAVIRVHAQMPPPSTAWLTDWRVASNQVAAPASQPKFIVWQVDFGFWDAPRWYVIYTSRDLLRWTPIVCDLVPDNGLVRLIVDATDPQRFFRVEQMTDF